MTERKMAVIKRIDEIIPIPDCSLYVWVRIADELIVAKSNTHQVNDLVVHLCKGAFVPQKILPLLDANIYGVPILKGGTEGTRLLRCAILHFDYLHDVLHADYPVELTLLYAENGFRLEGIDVTKMLGIS